ncbi:MAG: hypothetical protein SGILL_000273 [Bacillariaceae sp.]
MPFGTLSAATAPATSATNGAMINFQSSSGSKPVDEYWQDDFRPLRDAGKGILAVLRRDEMSTHGDLYRRIISSTTSTASTNNGDAETNPAHHYFYPGSSSNNNGSSESDKTFEIDGKESTIHHMGTIPLPPALAEKRKKVKMSTMMGLFPQGQLAWLTIDDTVYLWSYNSSLDGTSDGAAEAGRSSQMMEFQMPSKQTILSVGLAKPKPGKNLSSQMFACAFLFLSVVVSLTTIAMLFMCATGVFKDTVEWCLVLTTMEEAVLCVLNRSTPSLGAPMTVVPTNFTVPSDWVSFLSVGSTKSGRIFLGGQDGNVYELDYDMGSHYLLKSAYGKRGKNALQQQLDRFYDGSDDISQGPAASTACPDILVDKSLASFQSSTERVLVVGKRVLDAALPGMTASSAGSYNRSRKCRKLNHSNDGFLKHVLPEFISQVGNIMFGNSSDAGGAITQIVVDDERQLVYTLSSPKGWICVFDMMPSPTMPTQNSQSTRPKLTLAATVDMPSTARSYLESVARGRLSPAGSSRSFQEGALCFLGNAEAAQAGVGGMEGARRILRQVESDNVSRSDNSGRKRSGTGVNILTPVSLQIVPCRESTRITLVAVSSGGLRYYLSTLDTRSIGGGPSTSRPGQNQWKPMGKRMTLYHVRASPPPPQDGARGSPNGLPPTILDNVQVDASCYRLGTFIVALEPSSRSSTSNNDIVVATTLDATKRLITTQEKDGKKIVNRVSPGGLCEQLSTNLSGANGLSGGRVWSIEPCTITQSDTMTLALHSKTPSDSELSYVVPPFTPSSKSKKSSSSTKPADGGSIVATTRSGTVSSVGFGIMMNVLLGRPATYGINVQKPVIKPFAKVPAYRISSRHVGSGFSTTAADTAPQLKSAAVARSARLSPWLLHPKAVSLEPAALHHLEPYESTFLAMNVGGIHSYKSISVLGRFRNAILFAGSNAPSDPAVDKYFQDYGLEEGCAMCFMLITSRLSSQDLKRWSLLTVVKHSFNPRLLPLDDSEAAMYQQASKNDPWVPAGYVWKPSHCYEGFFLAAARLLRPIWYKPAVVVTEGRLVKRGPKTITTATKVELLLDEDATDQISQPILELEDAIARFRKAIDTVPSKSGKNMMFFNSADADDLARQIEEKNLHSLYRLLSRTTQLLSLLYHLRRADAMADIPEVEWGLLHGLQFAQLVETSTGQERIESVLNMLVISTGKSAKGPSADSNRLADILTQSCYYFFSSGNRNAFLGFQSAQEALGIPSGQSRRAVKTAEAADYLLKAAKYWYSPSLVTGQLLQTRDSERFVEVAERAIRHNSPLAKACSCLVELGDVSNVVHICLATASNFSNDSKTSLDKFDLPGATSLRSWEVGLYHKRRATGSDDASLSPGKTVPTGTNVTPKEAINTCYSMVFYYLSKFLDAPIASDSYVMGEKMVSVCAFRPEKRFLRAFFEFMLKDNHKDVLLRISSPELESWLASKQTDDPDLLMKYFQIQNKRFEAGDLARNRACDVYSKMSIFDRIEYLEIAVSSFSAAIAVGETPANRANVEQVKKETEGLLNIAKLQSRTMQAMESTMYEVSSEAMQLLEFSLLGASELLNKFAWPFDMFEICLLLFKACNHDDPTHTSQLWKSLMSTCFLPASTRNPAVFQKLEDFMEETVVGNPKISLLDASETSDDPAFENGDWIEKIEDAVARLGQEILGTGADFVFPVELLRKLFLGASPSNDGTLRPEWTFSTLLSAGVPFKVAFDSVYRVLGTSERGSLGGLNSGQRLEDMETAVAMLESFVEAARAHRPGYGNVGYMDIKAAIDKVRVDLQSIPENVALVENRLYDVEQASSRITQY